MKFNELSVYPNVPLAKVSSANEAFLWFYGIKVPLANVSSTN